MNFDKDGFYTFRREFFFGEIEGVYDQRLNAVLELKFHRDEIAKMKRFGTKLPDWKKVVRDFQAADNGYQSLIWKQLDDDGTFNPDMFREWALKSIKFELMNDWHNYLFDKEQGKSTKWYRDLWVRPGPITEPVEPIKKAKKIKVIPEPPSGLLEY